MLGIFLDTETSGLDPFRHHVLEIAIKIVNLKAFEELDSYSAIILHDKTAWEASDPESLSVNGFTWKLVQTGQPLTKTKEDILKLFKKHEICRGKSVFICQNPSFDRPFFSHIIPVDLQESLRLPYHWLDLASMHWAKQGTGPLSKDLIAAAYGLPPETHPHRAMNGVDHLIQCYHKVLSI